MFQVSFMPSPFGENAFGIISAANESGASGFTVIINVTGTPVQPIALAGVTVIVALTGECVLFIAVKEGKLPVPFAARPMAVVLFVQLKTAPVPVKLTGVVIVPLSKIEFATGFTVGFA